MTQKEREKLWSCIDDIVNSDEQTDALVSLFNEVKRMINYKHKRNEYDK